MNEIETVRPGGVLVVKLTDSHMRTYGGYQWVLHERRTFPGTGPLCSAGWCHAYSDPVIATWLNPIGANFPAASMRGFQGYVPAGAHLLCDGSLKVGVDNLTLIKPIALPALDLIDCVVLAIYAVRAIPRRTQIPAWETWADAVLASRTIDAAEAAAAEAAVRAGAAAEAQHFSLRPIVRQWQEWKGQQGAHA